MPPSMIWEIALGSFGVAAAVVLVGGWVLLRFHRDRQQFQLMQAALERGIAHLPGAVPGWVLSLRQGVLALVLGLGVMVAGGALAASATRIDEIPTAVAARFQQDRPPPPFPPSAERGPDNNAMHDGRPPLDPLMERWHRIEAQRLIGLLALCAGGILALLGIVRIAFARVERRYALEIAGSTLPPPPFPPAPSSSA